MTGTLLVDGTIITVDPERRILTDTAIYVEADRIREIGPADGLRKTYPSAEVIDCRGRVITPGLVNTHTHLFQTLLKGLGDDMMLKDWFTCMTGPSAAALTERDVLAAARHGCAESIRGGTTTLIDFMYVHPRPRLTDAVLQAYHDTGMRGVVARGCITTGVEVGVPEPLVETVEDYVTDAQRLIDEQSKTDNRVRVGLAPCMIWTVDADTLTATRELADDTGAPITMHVSETPFEIENALQRFGMRDLEVMAHVGMLGPDVLAVHCVYCRPRDLRILHHHNVKVSHNPCSNLYLASGTAPIPDMLLAGITVGLGSDGPASNNNHNMVQAMKFAALSHKGHHRDPTVITAEKVFEMATIDGARALNLQDEIGSIEIGKKADLVVFRLDNLFTMPVHRAVSALVYSALGNEAEFVMIDGQSVLVDGSFQNIEAAAIMEDAQVAAHDLAQRAGTQGLASRPWQSLRY
jgi:5-methylthioadenosine/S-adenosylhomocysteine deaminase